MCCRKHGADCALGKSPNSAESLRSWALHGQAGASPPPTLCSPPAEPRLQLAYGSTLQEETVWESLFTNYFMVLVPS